MIFSSNKFFSNIQHWVLNTRTSFGFKPSQIVCASILRFFFVALHTFSPLIKSGINLDIQCNRSIEQLVINPIVKTNGLWNEIDQHLTWDMFCYVYKIAQIHKIFRRFEFIREKWWRNDRWFPWVNERKTNFLCLLLHLILYDLCETRHKKTRR